VLSTVSGGSILGAYYYLEVQHLLETKSDSDMTREDYIEIVKRVQQNFLEGVQSNIRMRAFGDFKKNLRVMLGWNYTRGHYLGELYEEALYSRINDGRGGTERAMQQLLINPKGEPQEFKPKFANWRRRAKAPVLLLSATSLNSGHIWQFTASWMGEPPGLLEEFNVNERYRRLYYQEAPAHLQDYRLGHAVAASACVLGLFEPLTINGLYEDRTVRLVDGGMHDNQGVSGLLDEGCTMILCSDASGQIADLAKPGEDPAGVAFRSSSILQARVREAECQNLRARLDSRSLEGLLFLHTKKGLGINLLPWIGCHEEKYPPLDEDKPTPYGVNARLQRLIASIRTDLDSFTEVEAYALMASGYLMAKHELQQLQRLRDQEGEVGSWGGYQINAPSVVWPFAEIIPLLGERPENSTRGKDLEQQLKAASSVILKAWKLIPDLRRNATITVAGMVVLLLTVTWLLWGVTIFSLTLGGLVLVLVGLAIVQFAPALRWLSLRGEARSLVLKTAMALAGYALAKVYLKWINRRFLEHGRLSRLLYL